MAKSGRCFTLAEISRHILNQVIRTDASFQLAQQNAWHEMDKDFPLTIGMGQQEKLNLNELSFGFTLVAYQPSFWKRMWLLLYPIKKREAVYCFARDSEAGIPKYVVNITIGRNNSGVYHPEIKVAPDMNTKPEDTYVADYLE